MSAGYRGFPRLMCPHVIGLKQGKEHALFFQFAGGSKSGLPPGGEWRCLDLSELFNISTYEGRWRHVPEAQELVTPLSVARLDLDHLLFSP